MPLMAPISPKSDPGPSVEIVISSPSSPRNKTRASPLAITKSFDGSSPWEMRTVFAWQRSWAMRSANGRSKRRGIVIKAGTACNAAVLRSNSSKCHDANAAKSRSGRRVGA